MNHGLQGLSQFTFIKNMSHKLVKDLYFKRSSADSKKYDTLIPKWSKIQAGLFKHKNLPSNKETNIENLKCNSCKTQQSGTL